MKENKTKNYIICGAIALVIVGVLIGGFFLLKNNNNTPNINGPTNDFVNNGGNTEDPINSNDEILPPSEYVLTMLGANEKDRQIATMLEPWLRWDDVTKTYSHLIGDKFLSDYKIADTTDGIITVPNNTKRVFFFITYDDETVNSYIEDYLLLAARAKDVGAYDLYVINTNFDTMEGFIQKNLGYVQNSQTEEIIKFFETLPDNFLVYVGEDNVIEFISSARNAYSTSEIAAYVFGTDIPCREIMAELVKYSSDFESAYQEYLSKKESSNVSEIESISKLNMEHEYVFKPIDEINLSDWFNGIPFKQKFISLKNGVLEYSGYDENNPNNMYYIYQSSNLRADVVSISSYEYFNEIDIDSISVKLYGKSKEEIVGIEFIKDNMKVGLILVGTSFSIDDVEVFVRNF